MDKGPIIVFIAFLVLGIGGYTVFGGNSNVTGNTIALGGSGELVEIKTIIQNFRYNPDTITVKRGSKVRLTIENKDSVVHGLHLPQFGISDSQKPLGTKVIEFTAIETKSNGNAVPTCSQEHGETLTFNIV